MPVVGAAVIPPALHLGSLREDVDHLLASLPPFDVAVLLASGSEPLLHDAPVAEGQVPGGRGRRADIAIDTDLLTAIARRGQAPRVQSAAVNRTLGALGLLVHDHHPAARAVPMTVPGRATADALDGIAAGIDAAIRAVGHRTLIVAEGDLAGSAGAASARDERAPEGGVPDGDARVEAAAGQWDEHAAAAIAGSDHAALRALGPDAAQAVGASGWAPLHVLLAICHANGLRIGHSTYAQMGRIGRLVAVTRAATAEGCR